MTAAPTLAAALGPYAVTITERATALGELVAAVAAAVGDVEVTRIGHDQGRVHLGVEDESTADLLIELADAEQDPYDYRGDPHYCDGEECRHCPPPSTWVGDIDGVPVTIHLEPTQGW